MKKDILHLKAPGNWINDPNGFIYFKGEYHMFYQYFPGEPRWGTMHWGHAVSPDLVRWEHKGIALFPSKYADQNGCFSGSALEHEGCMYLFYTGVHYLMPNPENIHLCLDGGMEASQIMITSEDGMNFDNYNKKRVVVPPIMDQEIGDTADTRDPKVWRGKDAWYMILGSKTQNQKGKALFYRSENLTEWTWVNSVSKDQDLGWMWECPDYFETEGGKVLVISPMGLMQEENLEPNQSICAVVEFEEETCQMEIPDEYQFLDYGMDLYAPQSTLDAEGRRVLMAWLRMPEAVDGTEGKWNGMFCLPRVVTVKDGHIFFQVHPNADAMYRKEIADSGEAGESGYKVSLELKEGEWLNVGGYRVWRERNQIHVDRSAVFGNYKGWALQCKTPEIRDGYHLDVYVEPNMIEIYVNQGEYVISHVVYGLKDKITASSGSKLQILAAGE